MQKIFVEYKSLLYYLLRMAQRTKPKPEDRLRYVGFYMEKTDVDRLRRAAHGSCRSMSAQARLLVLEGLGKETKQ